MFSRVSIASIVQPHLAQLTPYQAGKPLEELARELGLTDAIKLASNENPLGPSPRALEAIKADLASLHRYPDSHAYYLKEDLSRHLGIEPSQLYPGKRLRRSPGPPGAGAGPPRRGSDQHQPHLPDVRSFDPGRGGVFRPVPLQDMAVDLEAVLQAVSDNTRLILLNSPNNPTGTVFSRLAWESFSRLPACHGHRGPG